MTTPQQAESLSIIIQAIVPLPYSESERQELFAAAELIEPLLKPQTLYAGYELGHYYIRVNGDTKISTIELLKAQGYTLHFAAEHFGKPIMLKRRK